MPPTPPILIFLTVILFTFTCSLRIDEPGTSYSSGLPDVECSSPNDCTSSKGKPYCVNGTCKPCNPLLTGDQKRCQCDLNQYCVSYENDPEIGTCRDLESNILNQNCDESLEGLGMNLIQGTNDTVFCGRVIFGTDLKAKYVEWAGVCMKNICKACWVGLVPCLPEAHCDDGRSCTIEGKEIYAPVGVYSLYYAFDSPIIASFWITTIELYLVGVIVLLAGWGFIYYFYKSRVYQAISEGDFRPQLSNSLLDSDDSNSSD